jgi:feruloyl esterase
MAVIVAWRERGVAPTQIIVSHRTKGVEDRRLLVCQYPRLAAYKGKGDTTDAASYECTRP